MIPASPAAMSSIEPEITILGTEYCPSALEAIVTPAFEGAVAQNWAQSPRLHPYGETKSLGTLAAFEFCFVPLHEAEDLGKGATSPPFQENFVCIFVML
jgi:hypothetical protein